MYEFVVTKKKIAAQTPDVNMSDGEISDGESEIDIE